MVLPCVARTEGAVRKRRGPPAQHVACGVVAESVSETLQNFGGDSILRLGIQYPLHQAGHSLNLLNSSPRGHDHRERLSDHRGIRGRHCLAQSIGSWIDVFRRAIEHALAEEENRSPCALIRSPGRASLCRPLRRHRRSCGIPGSWRTRPSRCPDRLVIPVAEKVVLDRCVTRVAWLPYLRPAVAQGGFLGKAGGRCSN